MPFSDYSQRMTQNQVDLVRRFNRVVTQRIGALDDAYLSRGRSLGLSRLLWEIEPAGSEVRLLRARLGLDSAITLPMTEDTARIPRICPSAALQPALERDRFCSECLPDNYLARS